MFRALFRLVMLLIVLVAVGGFMLGWWSTTRDASVDDRTAGTSGQIDTTRAREVGAQVGEKTAAAANQAGAAMADASLTAKIKSKMALDDLVRARDVDVDTRNGVVTLSGVVVSEAERQRAVQLARETSGVTSVNDRLTVR
jgi:osmotically-inducible protein OsmY